MSSESLITDVQNVLDIYRLRCIRTQNYWLGSFSLQMLERRLQEGLDSIVVNDLPAELFPSLYDDELDAEEQLNNFNQESQAAIYLLHTLDRPTSSDTERALAYQRAYFWLGESNNPVLRAAALQVLALRPALLQSQSVIQLCERYEVEHLVPAFLAQNIAFPSEWIAPEAEVWQEDYPENKRVALLRWMGDSPSVSNQNFFDIVKPQLDGKPINSLSTGLSTVLIRAMLLRHVGNPVDAMETLLEAALEEQLLISPHYGQLIACAALSGETQFTLPILEFAQHKPEEGLPLLGVYGHKSGVMTLLTFLKNSNHQVLAAEVWQMITGQHLVQRTIMQAVDSKRRPKPNIQLVPDIASAESWWATHSKSWSDDQRLLYGLPPAVNVAHQLLHFSAGKQLPILLDWLAYLRREPHGCSPYGWFIPHRQQLAVFKDPHSKIPQLDLNFK